MKKDNNVFEKRNEFLVNELVRKKAIRKAAKVTIMMAVVVIISIVAILIFIPNTNIYQIILPSILITLLLVFCYLALTKVYQHYEARQLNIEIVNECITSDEFIEVIPIHADEHKEFILELLDIAKFLAIISKEDEIIEVYVKFNNEENLRFLEEIEKEDFLHYYSFVEENEEKEE